MKEFITLGEVCEKGSSTIMQKDLSLGNGPYEIYGASGLLGTVDFYKQENEYIGIVKDGAGVGRAKLLPKKSSCIGTMQYLIPKENINVRFLFYSIENMNLAKYNTGATIPHIYFKDYKKELLPLLDLQEQQEIVKKLDKVSDLISFRKEQLHKFDDLVKSQFIEMFGESGKQVPLSEYVWFQEGPGVRSVDFTSDGTILLTGSNINENIISFGYKSDRYISNELANGKYSHFMCDRDDILVVSSAIDPDKFDKKVVVVDADKKYCLNTGIIRFKPNKRYLTLEYFREFLKTNYFKRQVSSEMRGIAQLHFGPSHLKKMSILLPQSLDQQNQFAAFVEQTEKSKFAIKQSLEKLEACYKALLQKYFG